MVLVFSCSSIFSSFWLVFFFFLFLLQSTFSSIGMALLFFSFFSSYFLVMFFGRYRYCVHFALFFECVDSFAFEFLSTKLFTQSNVLFSWVINAHGLLYSHPLDFAARIIIGRPESEFLNFKEFVEFDEFVADGFVVVLVDIYFFVVLLLLSCCCRTQSSFYASTRCARFFF